MGVAEDKVGSAMLVLEDLPKEVTRTYTRMKTMPDGQIVGIKRLLFHWTLHIGIDWTGYADRYCYPSERAARMSLKFWDGSDDPPGNWQKHPRTGRYRNLKTGEISLEWKV